MNKETPRATRCEGYRRYGGAFTLGPVRWEQCPENAIVTLTVEQPGGSAVFPACAICWKEAVEKKIKILKAQPI
jgi:hypothetical protein